MANSKWTTKEPSTPGWYCYDAPGDALVGVVNLEDENGRLIRVHCNPGTLWFGPLPKRIAVAQAAPAPLLDPEAG